MKFWRYLVLVMVIILSIAITFSKPVSAQKPSTPANVSTALQPGIISLSWVSFGDADGFVVYKYDDMSNQFKEITQVKLKILGANIGALISYQIPIQTLTTGKNLFKIKTYRFDSNSTTSRSDFSSVMEVNIPKLEHNDLI